MNSSSSDYFQNFDKLLERKRSSSSAPESSQSKSSSSTAFERFSVQFDKQFGKPPQKSSSNSHDSSSGFAVAETAIIVDILSRDPKTKKSDEQQQQAFSRSLKARDLHKDSKKLYNQEQSQFCREVGVHPDSYMLHELDDDNSSGILCIIMYYVVVVVIITNNSTLSSFLLLKTLNYQILSIYTTNVSLLPWQHAAGSSIFLKEQPLPPAW